MELSNEAGISEIDVLRQLRQKLFYERGEIDRKIENLDKQIRELRTLRAAA